MKEIILKLIEEDAGSFLAVFTGVIVIISVTTAFCVVTVMDKI